MRELAKTQNVKVIEDELLFLEWEEFEFSMSGVKVMGLESRFRESGLDLLGQICWTRKWAAATATLKIH